MYPAGRPIEGKWAIAWQGEMMLCPAFWYYDTEDEAQEVLNRFVDDGYEHYEFVKEVVR
jgi:hypothetical protein